MNGDLANTIALGLHGSAWLASGTGRAPALERSNSTFGYVDVVEFASATVRGHTAEPVTGTAAWLKGLKESGVNRLWLVVFAKAPSAEPPHEAVAFAGGGQWALLSDGERPTLWVPSWTYANPHDRDNRVWNIRYSGHALDASAAPHRPEVTAATEALRHQLVGAADFARANELAHWASWFDGALALMEAESPEIAYHPDIAPRGAVSAEAYRLLAMAVQAWVFGGMGTWNDVWLEDEGAQARYAEVSSSLYRAILDACVAATNADLEGLTRES